MGEKEGIFGSVIGISFKLQRFHLFLRKFNNEKRMNHSLKRVTKMPQIQFGSNMLSGYLEPAEDNNTKIQIQTHFRVVSENLFSNPYCTVHKPNVKAKMLKNYSAEI